MMIVATEHSSRLRGLAEFLARIPAVEADEAPTFGMSSGEADGRWWIRFQIDIDDDLAWETVEALAFAANAAGEATVLRPVIVESDTSEGPEDSLVWMLDAPLGVSPDDVRSRLESLLPYPVDDLAAWGEEDEDDDDDDDGPEEDEAGDESER